MPIACNLQAESEMRETLIRVHVDTYGYEPDEITLAEQINEQFRMNNIKKVVPVPLEKKADSSRMNAEYSNEYLKEAMTGPSGHGTGVSDDIHMIQESANGKGQGQGKVVPLIMTEFSLGVQFTYATEVRGEVKTVTVGKDGRTPGAYYPAIELYFNKKDSESRLFRNEEGRGTIEDADAQIIEARLINDPKNMKKVMEELIDYDGVDISEQHAERLRAVIDKFVDPLQQYIPDMMTRIRKSHSKNRGAMYTSGRQKGIWIEASDVAQHAGNQMSAAETYVHEMIHAVVEFAPKDVVARHTARIAEVYDKVMEEITWKDFMPAVSIDAKAEKKIAKARIAYLSQEETGLEEFMAMALTNDSLYRVLKRVKVNEVQYESNTLWEKILNSFLALFNSIGTIIRGETKDTRGDEVIEKMLRKIAANNNQAVIKIREKASIIGAVGRISDLANTKLANVITKAIKLKPKDYKAPSKPVGDMSRLEKFKHFAKNARVLMFSGDPHMRGAFEGVLSALGLKPEGTLQQIMMRFRDSDGLEKAVEEIGLLAEQIDRHTEAKLQTVGALVRQGFDIMPSKAEAIALSKVLVDNDVAALDMTVEELSKLMESEENIDKAIEAKRKELKKALTEEKAYNYMASQAMGLGRFMNTGEGGSNQLTNARAIAMGVGLGKIYSRKWHKAKVDDTIKIVDELATLEGLKRAPAESRALTKQVIDRDSNGVKNVLAYAKKANMDINNGMDDSWEAISTVKGYTAETGSNFVHTKIASIELEDELREDGYKKVSTDGVADGYALYANTDGARAKWDKRGVRTINKGVRRNSMLNMIGAQVGQTGAARTRMMNEVVRERIRKGALDRRNQLGAVVMPEAQGMVPVYKIKDGKAIIADFDMRVDKQVYEQVTHTHKQIWTTIAKTTSRAYDVKLSKESNKAAVTLVMEDMKDNFIDKKLGGQYTGRNGMEYIKIGPDEDNEISKKIWPVLPGYLKQRFLNAGKEDVNEDGELEKPKFIAVRRNLVHQLFGDRDPSIMDSKWAKAIVPNKTAQHIVRLAEMIWSDVVGLAKVNIVLKTPAVLRGNITSNYLFALAKGQNPVGTFDGQVKGVEELRRYLKQEKERGLLEEKERVGTISKEEKQQLKRLKVLMKRNTVAPLMEAGLYTGIIEDVSSDDMHSSSYLEEKLDDALGKLPEGVKSILDGLYITERTPVFKALMMATQYSDFVARYDRYWKLKREGKSDKVALKEVLDMHINYSWLDGSKLRWIQKVGFAWFIKFFIGIQRPLRQAMGDKPATMIASVVAQEMLGDADDVTDHSLFTKNYSALVPGIGKLVDEATMSMTLETLQGNLKF